MRSHVSCSVRERRRTSFLGRRNLRGGVGRCHPSGEGPNSKVPLCLSRSRSTSSHMKMILFLCAARALIGDRAVPTVLELPNSTHPNSMLRDPTLKARGELLHESRHPFPVDLLYCCRRESLARVPVLQKFWKCKQFHYRVWVQSGLLVPAMKREDGSEKNRGLGAICLPCRTKRRRYRFARASHSIFRRAHQSNRWMEVLES